jgi:hypothetical protein
LRRHLVFELVSRLHEDLGRTGNQIVRAPDGPKAPNSSLPERSPHTPLTLAKGSQSKLTRRLDEIATPRRKAIYTRSEVNSFLMLQGILSKAV